MPRGWWSVVKILRVWTKKQLLLLANHSKLIASRQKQVPHLRWSQALPWRRQGSADCIYHNYIYRYIYIYICIHPPYIQHIPCVFPQCWPKRQWRCCTCVPCGYAARRSAIWHAWDAPGTWNLEKSHGKTVVLPGKMVVLAGKMEMSNKDDMYLLRKPGVILINDLTAWRHWNDTSSNDFQWTENVEIWGRGFTTESAAGFEHLVHLQSGTLMSLILVSKVCLFQTCPLACCFLHLHWFWTGKCNMCLAPFNLYLVRNLFQNAQGLPAAYPLSFASTLIYNLFLEHGLANGFLNLCRALFWKDNIFCCSRTTAYSWSCQPT